MSYYLIRFYTNDYIQKLNLREDLSEFRLRFRQTQISLTNELTK